MTASLSEEIISAQALCEPHDLGRQSSLGGVPSNLMRDMAGYLPLVCGLTAKHTPTRGHSLRLAFSFRVSPVAFQPSHDARGSVMFNVVGGLLFLACRAHFLVSRDFEDESTKACWFGLPSVSLS